MPQYLVSIQLPDDYDPSLESEEVIRNVHALNEEMDAAGIRLFAGGLEPTSKAKTLRKQANEEVIITDGSYVEAKEHIGGFSIVEAADMDAPYDVSPDGQRFLIVRRATEEDPGLVVRSNWDSGLKN
jgi:hypothetical protein